MTGFSFIPMRCRAARLGRKEVPIRRGNPSSYIGSGLVPSILPGDAGRCVWYAGSLQREMLLQLNTDPDIVFIDGEAPPVRWMDGLRWFEYRPPFVAHRKNGRKTIIEVQWGAFVLKYGLREVLAMIEPFAQVAGYDRIELWTDSQIREPARIFNSNLLHSVSRKQFDPALLEQVRESAHRLGREVRIGSLRASIVHDGQVFRAIAKLISTAELVPADPRQLIDDRLAVTAISLLTNEGERK